MKEYTLLYAEDEEEIREAYTEYFKSLFKSVYAASDGREALKFYKEKKPDILVFDITMPYLDGITLVEQIRLQETQSEILLLSAHIDADKLLRAIPLGLTNYLVKPVKKKELESSLMSMTYKLDKRLFKTIELDKELLWSVTKQELTYRNNVINLTKREAILIEILTNDMDNYHSIDKIVEKFIVDYSLFDTTQDSVRNSIKRLKQKLPEGTLKNTHGLGYKIK